MGYIVKDKASGTFKKLSKIDSFKETDFETKELFELLEIDRSEYKEIIKQNQINLLIEQQKKISEQLAALTEVEVEQDDEEEEIETSKKRTRRTIQKTITKTQKDKTVIDKNTGQPIKEAKKVEKPTVPGMEPLLVEKIYGEFMQEANTQEFVINTENGGDHFVINITEPRNLPKTFHGVPIRVNVL